ncbi:Branched-chain-amino-acid aminotransferase [Rathayibacter tanaceti]|uniref:Branched-chain-amino-acid aminotransferase n=1 Tax=Rathayibacter tanaceti TaxID=1671680 RepID=A0A162GNP1_9MICO|nr:Branched-chain-amino-acid aminotransferase [Rathayibacter tanaceti]
MSTDSALTDLDFEVTPAPSPRSAEERARILAHPGFGVHFTDHMVGLRWTRADGWHSARVQPYGPLALDPAAAVLHYAQEIFEGMKAYRHEDGSIWTFRPEANARRLQRSARRLALPELPTGLFLESLRRLIAADGDWVPSEPETSLYLRPFMFAQEAFLGVRAAEDVGYYLIASPAGAYFSGGVAPVSIWLSTSYAARARAAPERRRPAATTPRRSCRSRRPRATAARRCSSSTRRSRSGSRSSVG